MCPFAIILAYGLLAAPPSDPPPFLDPEMFDVVRLPLQTIALSEEILDPREVRYCLYRRDDFTANVNLLRRRRAELHDAPLVGTAYLQLPPRAVINEYCTANMMYQAHLKWRQDNEQHRWQELEDVMDECRWLYLVWDAARDAQCEYHYISTRRGALEKLRNMIGPEAFYRGQLPNWLPSQRFVAITLR